MEFTEIRALMNEADEALQGKEEVWKCVAPQKNKNRYFLVL